MEQKCTVCGNDIKIAIFKNTPWCSADCKKKVVDVSSVGTFMFVTSDEANIIQAARGKGVKLTSSKEKLVSNG